MAGQERIKDLIRTILPEDIAEERRWIQVQVETIGINKLKQLSERAAKNRELSYSPYSNYRVGAVLVTLSGEEFDGANFERVSYSETIHAEESAISHAMIKGEHLKERKFINFIVISHEGEGGPCAHCLQNMVEHCDNALVVIANPQGEITGFTSLGAELTNPFTPTDLGR